MDTRRIIGEVAKRHGLILREDDPVLLTVTLSQFILEEYVEKLNVNLERAYAKEMNRARETAEATVARAGTQVVEQIRTAGAAIAADLARVLDGRAEVIAKETASARRLRRHTLWCVGVAGVAAAVVLAAAVWGWQGARAGQQRSRGGTSAALLDRR